MEAVSPDALIDLQQSARIKIKENLLKLSGLFSSHKLILMSMCDDILCADSNYFVIQHFWPSTQKEIKSFILTTTAIYSGIFTQLNPLKIKDNQDYHESCVISFSEQQKIISVEFKIILNRCSKKELITIRLNSRFEIINFTWKAMDNSKIIFQHDIDYKGFSAPDFVQLLRLECNATEQIIELLPELVIPSAYNMRSDEFKDRLSLVDMILI